MRGTPAGLFILTPFPAFLQYYVQISLTKCGKKESPGSHHQTYRLFIACRILLLNLLAASPRLSIACNLVY